MESIKKESMFTVLIQFNAKYKDYKGTAGERGGGGGRERGEGRIML